MTNIRIETTANGRIALCTPYNPDLPAQAKALGGRWDATSRAWTFDARDEERVRDLARTVFGTDGSAADQADLVTIRTTVDDARAPKHGAAQSYCLGRLIATRRGRDEDVSLGQGVVLISGGFAGAGGSTTYPQISPLDGTIVEIRDVPRAALEGFDGEFAIVSETFDADALFAERAKLEARLQEIGQQLAAHGVITADPEETPTVAHAVPADAAGPGVITVRIDIEFDGTQGASTSAFAAVAGRSARTVRRWAAAGRIPATRTSRGWIITA